MRSIVFVLLFISCFSVAQTSFEKAETLFRINQFNEAESLFIAHLESNPNDFKTIEYLGDIAGHKKDWDKAIVNYKILVEAQPKNANYHYKYGGVLGMKALSVSKFRAIGIVMDAKEEFLKAAELDSKHINTRWALVELYMRLPGIIGGSKKKALKYANELFNLSEVDGYLSRGFIYEYDNEFELAEYNYLKAVEIGGSVVCYQNLIDLYISFEKTEQAKFFLEKAIKVHQSNEFKTQLQNLKQSN